MLAAGELDHGETFIHGIVKAHEDLRSRVHRLTHEGHACTACDAEGRLPPYDFKSKLIP